LLRRRACELPARAGAAPSLARDHYNLANTLAELGRRDEAVRHYAQALALEPDEFPDFFSLSDCRDHLFHVRENTLEIPQIGAFPAEHDLAFLGFEVDPGTLQRYA
jgi:tetratricopeptide (TPR) repeat protein